MNERPTHELPCHELPWIDMPVEAIHRALSGAGRRPRGASDLARRGWTARRGAENREREADDE
jgi:hypothetical protein